MLISPLFWGFFTYVHLYGNVHMFGDQISRPIWLLFAELIQLTLATLKMI